MNGTPHSFNDSRGISDIITANAIPKSFSSSETTQLTIRLGDGGGFLSAMLRTNPEDPHALFTIPFSINYTPPIRKARFKLGKGLAVVRRGVEIAIAVIANTADFRACTSAVVDITIRDLNSSYFTHVSDSLQRTAPLSPDRRQTERTHRGS